MGMQTARKAAAAGGPRYDRGTKKGGLRIGTALIIISRLGGALNRNAGEAPGPQTLLRGLRRFHDIGLGFMLRTEESTDLITINKFVGHAQT